MTVHPARWRRLDLTVARRVDGLVQGDTEGLRLGPGGDREELARYQAGDDPRHVDWNVTARAGDLHVWRTRAQHELDTWLLLDDTASMAFGTVEQEKRSVAIEVGAVVGLLTDGPGNRVGVARLDADGLHWSRPVGPRTAARVLIGAADAPSAREGAPPLDLAAALDAVQRRAARPGLRVVVSDLLDGSAVPTEGFAWERPLRRLAARHDVVVVQVVDPREVELPAVGHLTVVDPETGAQQQVWPGDARLRRRYAEAAADHLDAAAAAVRHARCGHVVLRTDRDWAADLTTYLRARRRVARRPCRRTAR